MIIDEIIERVKTQKMRIVLPEGEDPRVVEAAEKCKEFAEPILLAGEDAMERACEMVSRGEADGIVSGACHSTADTLRPALHHFKDGYASAFFLMEMPDGRKFIFADSGLNQNPTAEQLGKIAADAADSYELIVGGEPRVAMLSHSTFGSASHPDVDKVVEAVKIAKERAPMRLIDGEMQADVALSLEVAEKKGIKSEVAGKANVLVFPDLDAGNIAYKLVQYLANAKAYGPIVQGLGKPVNDLSRGCTADDIVGVVAITALQAINKKD
ncbi:MAG: phosphate acyltransferase [Candidatus Saccharibacteria bacterium]|nr:phosphate acyltransferase [Candidatus Saccharibacteria bacterium]